MMKSGKKQIVYDENSGRFFESNKDEGDCIPDEEFCVIDKDSGTMIRLTVEEKERIFLDALQAYYFDNRQMLNDDEFDLLKEDLQWNGSEVVQMNRKEATYLAAVQDYMKGTPSMADGEFDALKKELMEAGSVFAVAKEPQCYIDTGICKVTLQEDNFRMNLLYLPASTIIFVAWLGLGFEFIEPIIRLNPIILALLGTPFVVQGSKFITDNFLFQNSYVAYGPCPSCQASNRVYFGDILGVEGFDAVATVKCPNCKETFNVQRNTLRASTLPKA
ncbi:PGR5-like protein 1A [Seminavis robusta]|uniref:PGR5-like protein 1A n=1 Tax=Seminavis robusta TaxID=568900 RepID=A0A9N8DSB2_9STRA|nr:PGR5-like protein 1A [Seminavis robusta]|eukprot:Sro245_g097310.1 PGR5-like protein 1A (275) ;mRNA; f:20871-21773